MGPEAMRQGRDKKKKKKLGGASKQVGVLKTGMLSMTEICKMKEN